jgi:hypothetical protein
MPHKNDFAVSVNPASAAQRPAQTHWSNAFTYRHRAEVTADAKGKPTLTIAADMLDMIGARVGDEVLLTITSDGAVLGRKIQI